MSSFKINSAKDFNISDFFEVTEVPQWGFQNYYEHILKKDRKVKINSAKRIYINDIDRLLNFGDLPDQLKSILGRLKSEANYKDRTSTNTIINNHGIYLSNNNNCSFGDSTVNAQEQQSGLNKKRKISTIDEDGCWNINCDDDFWKSWKEYLEDCDCHDFCLEKLHIIECGYTIKCKPSYDEDLYQQLGHDTKRIIKSPFVTHNTCTTQIIQSLQGGNERSILKALSSDQLWELIEKPDLTAKYVYDFFQLIHHYVTNMPAIHESEAKFNHQIIYPLMSLVVKTLAAVIPTLVFYPGEMSLDSFDEEYKADGLIKLDSMEVCLLETSGHYGLKDLPRFGYDHIKGSFGALTFIRKLLKTWYFANVDTVLSLKVFFIHVREKKIHLWSLETSMQDVQVLENIISSEIPINAAEAGKMLDFGNLIWKLKDGIKKTCEVVDQMKKEHEEYLLQRQLNPDVEKRINLATFVQQEIQKPVRGSKYGLLLPEHFEDCHQKKD